jgi:hypothetical protein
MQLSKTNDLIGNSVLIVNGSIVSGSANNVLNTNWSSNLTMTGATITLNLGSVTNCKYVAIHGLHTNLKGNSVLLTVTVNGQPIDGVSSLYTATDKTHTIIFANDDPDFAGLSGVVLITINNSVNSSSYWSFGFIQAGDVTHVPNGGVQGGQVYAYLQNNFISRNTTNENGAPTGSINRRVTPIVPIRLNKMPNYWVNEDLQDVFDLYNTQGVISVYDGVALLDTGEVPRHWAWAAFGLTQNQISADGDLAKLVSVSLTFRAAF